MLIDREQLNIAAVLWKPEEIASISVDIETEYEELRGRERYTTTTRQFATFEQFLEYAAQHYVK